MARDRDADGRARQGRPRDRLGRPLPHGAVGVEPVSEEPLPPAETLDLSRRLLTQGRPFSAHEVLEARWKDCPAGERDLWQGLAQVCVAVTHAERGNRVGAERLLERGRLHLESALDTRTPAYGVDVAGLIAWAASPDAALTPPSPSVPL